MTGCMCSFARSFNNKKIWMWENKGYFFLLFLFVFFPSQTWTTTFLSFCRPPMRPRFPKERRWARLWLRCQPLIWTLVCTGWWETSALIVNDILLPVLFLLHCISLCSSDPLCDPEGWKWGLSVLQHWLPQWDHLHSSLFWPWAESFISDRGAVTGRLGVGPTRPAGPA